MERLAVEINKVLDYEIPDQDKPEIAEFVQDYISEQRELQKPIGRPGDTDDLESDTHVPVAEFASVAAITNHGHDAQPARDVLSPDDDDVNKLTREHGGGSASWNEKVSSWDTPPGKGETVQCNIPPQDDSFVGREIDLHAMHEALSTLGQLCTISGRSGIGKTATAAQYTHRFGQDYAYVFWVEAENPGVLADKFAMIAETLDVAQGNQE
jgi:hypothetical protein